MPCRTYVKNSLPEVKLSKQMCIRDSDNTVADSHKSVLKHFALVGNQRKAVAVVYCKLGGCTYELQAPEFYKKLGFELEFVRRNNYNSKLNKYYYVKYFDKSDSL